MLMSQLADDWYAEAAHTRDSLALSTSRLQELECFRNEAVQLYLSFLNLIKRKTLQR